MQLVSILRLLLRHRVIVVMGLAFALPIGVLTSYSVKDGLPPKLQSRQYEIGIASAAVLVDSPSSQVLDLGGGPTQPDVSALSVRAQLLANLMATSPLKDEIAKRAGVRSDWLIAHPPAEGGAVADRTPQGPSATISEDDPRASVMRLHVHETLPIVTADISAPDAPTAERIASSSIAELQRYQQTAGNRVPGARKLVVSPLGAARSATEIQGRGPLWGAALFALVFGLWCAAIVGLSTLVRAWRHADADGDVDVGAAPTPTRVPQPGAAPAQLAAKPTPASAPPPVQDVPRANPAPRSPQPDSPRARSTPPPVRALKAYAERELHKRQQRERRAL